MSEIDRPTLGPEAAVERLSKTVDGIYLHDPTAEDQAFIDAQREKILDPADEGGVKLYEKLRETLADLDSEEGWHSTKEAARAELHSLPPDFLEQILERFSSLAKNLPAGHSKGHLLRDTINLAGMLHDPALESTKMDEVELLVGIVAGVFHDIGNSIVPRHIDAQRVGAHAEVSADLFGKVAEGVMPANLTRLIQYAIAAHTHYLKPYEINLPSGGQATHHVYRDDTTAGNRQSIWIARQSDRRDMSNVVQLVRDMVVHITPVQDSNGQVFYDRLSPEENFRAYYSFPPNVDENAILAHEIMYCQNVFRKNDYTSHDSDYFTHQLMEPGVGDLALLLTVVEPEKRNQMIADINKNDPEAARRLAVEMARYGRSTGIYRDMYVDKPQIKQAVESFKDICRMVEPAPDLEERLDQFENYFDSILAQEDKVKWTKTISFVGDVLIKRWKGRLVQSATGDLRLGSKITNQDPAIRQQFDEIGDHLQTIARQIIASMDDAGETS